MTMSGKLGQSQGGVDISNVTCIELDAWMCEGAASMETTERGFVPDALDLIRHHAYVWNNALETIYHIRYDTADDDPVPVDDRPLPASAFSSYEEERCGTVKTKGDEMETFEKAKALFVAELKAAISYMNELGQKSYVWPEVPKEILGAAMRLTDPMSDDSNIQYWRNCFANWARIQYDRTIYNKLTASS